VRHDVYISKVHVYLESEHFYQLQYTPCYVYSKCRLFSRHGVGALQFSTLMLLDGRQEVNPASKKSCSKNSPKFSFVEPV